MKSFKINGKTYKAKEVDFNFLCDLEDEGVSLDNMERKPMAAVRAYFTVCYGGDKESAGNEIQAHIINGGDLTDVMAAFSDAMQKSDFFRALTKRAQKKTATDQEAEE